LKDDGTEVRVRPRFRDVYGLSFGIILIGVLYASAGALKYYSGSPEHISESEEMGSRYFPAHPPGLPQHRMTMLFGVWVAAGGAAVLIGTGLVDAVFRIRKDKIVSRFTIRGKDRRSS
jgi:uncharacterized membrane protein SpoIIM required for sporulation